MRLTRKYAEMIDGVDLTEASVGDELDLSPRDAGVLIAEGWAEPSATPAPRHEPSRDEWETHDRPPRKRTSKEPR